MGPSAAARQARGPKNAKKLNFSKFFRGPKKNLGGLKRVVEGS